MTFHVRDRPQITWRICMSFLLAACLVQISWGFVSFDDEAADLAYDDGDDIEYRDLDTLYHSNVSKGNPEKFVFLIEDGMNMSAAIRVHVSSSHAQETEPIIFVVKQPEGVMSWQVPLKVINKNECEFQYESVARTLCPLQFGDEEISEVVIDVSCSSTEDTYYSLKATVVYEFDLEMLSPLPVTISPSQPQYYYFRFPEDVDAVQVRGRSEDKICAVIAVQEVGCPVFDLLRNVEFIGKFQTQTTQSSITVQAKDFRSREIFVVLVAHPDDSTCNNKPQCRFSVNDSKVTDGNYQPEGSMTSTNVARLKNMTLEIIRTKSSSVYWTGTMVMTSIFLCFYIAFLVYVFVQYRREEVTQNEGDRNDDNSDDKTKKYMLYSWNIIPMAVFYALPVIQLVFYYQVIHNETGNEDNCYYNFMCANSLGQMSAFNNIFSNIGYILLGFLYLGVVWWKATYGNRSEDYGIKTYFGLHYALGIALIMEGVLSGSYHVCPNASNYQFDTSYMYIMVCLVTLKLFQNRHPDELASAHVTYICLSAFAIIAVLGAVRGTLAFWICFAFVHIGVSCILTLLYFYEGHWPRSCSWPWSDGQIQNKDKKVLICKTVLVVIVNLGNISVAIAAAALQPRDFASYLLYILIGNSGLYFFFYFFIMKPASGERCTPKCKVCVFIFIFMGLTIAFWVPALYFFKRGLTDWKKTAAISREGNKDCSWFDFYDYHDIWHFLSAVALFFTFLTLLKVDDNLDDVKREHIAKF